ncbi:uncharacterized protein EDB93DRAFT_1331349 [Suillus bovinus]|uniref:uncharacterized protein n=1 Tax=Suillus bovinus TaxID=48563 RepID=UPI001B886F15|nr:uncharacterized protein EDB93DRAFT_1331349 [Suillus bovinus]KAG2133782.1 hypothetical protein EDB93DRAFT_1331349 [Suillus bovinus]
MKITSALILVLVACVQAQPSVNISSLPSSIILPTITLPPPPSVTGSTLTLSGQTLTPPSLSFGATATTSASTSTSTTAKSTGAAMARSYADTELVMGAVAAFFGAFAFLE